MEAKHWCFGTVVDVSLVGGFKYFLFLPLLGEMIQSD